MDINQLLRSLSDRVLRQEVALTLLYLYFLRLIASGLYKLFIYPYYVSPLRSLPGPKDHHFLIGHLLNQFGGSHPNEPYVSWMKRWPTVPLIRYFGFGNADSVLVTSLDAHKEILQTKASSFEKPTFFRRMVRDIVGHNGLGLVEGEEHKKQRRALSALFSHKNVESFIPQLRKKATDLCSLLDDKIRDEAGIADVVSLYSKTTLDIIGLFAAGKEPDELTLNSGGMPFTTCYQELFEPDGLGKLLIALNTVIPIRWLPIKANRRFKEAYETLHSQIQAVIRERIQELHPNKKTDPSAEQSLSSNDMLTWMVENKYYASDEDERWGEELISDQMLTFLAAGHQTTADGLTWATQLMIQHPAEEKRLREEIAHLGANYTYREIEALPYLHNFCREVLRAQCPSINIGREAIEDVIIQGVLLPKGTTVMMQPAIVQKNPTIWGEDADEFRPDRWDALEQQATDSWAFTAFGHGPRGCIGKAFSMLEFKILLIELVSRFRFARVEGDNRLVSEIEVVNPSPMLRPLGGLRMRVERA
ncbi:cytochrome P450 4F5 [Rhypophila decipiens]|uniref:Cytochrome P450 4F5 n=1 Tax=Rhypophila decipiens TaxID=261697 RepID=A0AAN6XZ60_9PEZI|nr:cytochrome P450 4F5 [Rhypophila decipiens]